jgi:mono/diheme cytochrome c family protein
VGSGEMQQGHPSEKPMNKAHLLFRLSLVQARAFSSIRAGGRVRAFLLALGMCISLPALAEADAKRGNELFQQYCQGCHGEDGRGSRKDGFMPRPQNLTKKGYIDELPDEYLFTVITKGGEAVNKSGYMPSFGKKFEKDDIDNLIAFIRSLARY